MAVHLVEHRSLPVHHFVVGIRHHEPLGMLVNHAEGELVVMPFTVERILPEILERIVHPAHVPLQIETDPAFFGRPGDAPPGG